MKLPAMTILTATVLAFAFAQTPPVLAQETEIGAASRPFPLDGGPSLGSDNRGQTVGEQSDGAKRSGDVSSEKSQTRIGKTGETAGLRVHQRHRVAAHERGGGLFAFHHHTHRLPTHRRGHRVVALNRSSGV